MNTQIDNNRKTKSIIIFLGMFFILAGAGLLAGNRFGNDVVGPTIMFEFALCFSAIVALSRKNQWAIIPAGLFASIGLVVTLEILIPLGEMTGPVFMFLLAVTFLVFATLSKKHWWAIIPVGIFTSVGLVAALDILVPHADFPLLPGMLNCGYYTWVLFLGLAATFGIVWLLRKTQPTRWAIYPAAGFLAMAALFILEGARFAEYWLVTTLLVCGVTLLLGVLTRKRPDAGQQVTGIKA